jgi:Fanconi anemia group M protein
MSDKPVRIKVDRAEFTSGVPRLLEGMGVQIESAELFTGDYILGPDVCCERKSAADLLASILDKRIFSQIMLMKAEFERPFVIVEGNAFQVPRSGIEKKAIAGLKSWIHTLETVSVYTTSDISETAFILEAAARHAQHGLGYEIALRGGTPKDTRGLSQFIVEGLPAVGPGRAKALLSHFGSVEKIFSASVGELIEVEGIGKAAAQKIYDAIRSKY